MLLLFGSGTLLGQQVSVYGVTPAPLPAMKAFLSATASDGSAVRPTILDLDVREDGVLVRNLGISCPLPATRPSSVVLSIDISTSMDRDIPPLVIQLAQQVALGITNTLPMPPNEVALQACDEFPRILSDFSTNKSRLSSMITSVRAAGGNDFVRQLLDPISGAVTIASRGTKQRSVVLITDAFWEELPPSSLQQAIDACALNNVRFFAVVLTERERSATGIVGSLQALAQMSGGGVFEGITTDSLASALVASIVSVIEGANPCTLTWDTEPLCSTSESRLLTVGVRGVDTVSYQLPARHFDKRLFVVSPDVVRFTSLPAGQSATATVRVRAFGSNVSVASVSAGDASITVAPTSFQLDTGQWIDLTVTYLSDGRPSFGTAITIRDPTCAWTMPLVRVLRAISPGRLSIEVEEPNGGEEILAGSDTVIHWVCSDTTRPVDVDVTINNAASWLPIARGVIARSVPWSPVPRTPSNTCLVRVSTTLPDTPDSLIACGLECTAIDIMPKTSGEYWSESVAIGTAHGFLARGVAGFARLNEVWQPHADTITDVVGHATVPAYLLTASVDGSVAWHREAATLSTMQHGSAVRCVQFSSDGMLCYSGADDGRIIEWDYQTGMQRRIVATFGIGILNMRTLGRDSLVVATADSILRCISTVDGSEHWQARLGTSQARSLEVHPIHHRIAVGLDNGSVTVVDQLTGVPIAPYLAVSPDQSPIVDVCFGNDNPSTSLVLAVDIKGSVYSTVPTTSSITKLDHYSRSGTCVARYDNVIVIGWSGSVTSSWVSPDPLSSAFLNDVDVVSFSALDRTARKLVTVSAGGVAWIWDVEKRRPERAFRLTRFDPLKNSALSPSGRYLAIPAEDEIDLYDLSNPTMLETTTSAGPGITGVRFDPISDTILGVGSIVGLTVMSIPSLQPGLTFPTTIGQVVDFAWSQDGSTLAFVETDARIHTVDMLTGMAQMPISLPNVSDQSIYSIAWKPNGSALIVGSASYLSMIDMAQRRVTLQTPLTVDGKEISVSPDGLMVAVVLDQRPNPVNVYDETLTLVSALGQDLGSRYLPQDGRFAGSEMVHCSSSLFGAGVVRNLGRPGGTVVSDLSDQLFSIVWPRLTTMDVDMGRVRVGNRKDSVVAGLVRTATRFRISADSMQIIGTDAGDFRVSIEQIPGTLNPMLLLEGEVTFTPNAVGLRSAECLIFYGTDTSRISLSGIGVLPALRLIVQDIDMGRHVIGTVLDSIVYLATNVSSAPVELQNICLAQFPQMPFRIVETSALLCATSRWLPPGDSISITLRFSPELIGATSTILSIGTNEGLASYIITVHGIGLGSTVRVRSDSGYPGDKRPITLEIADGGELATSGGTQNFEAELIYDRSVVVVDNMPTNANGSITIRGSWLGLSAQLTQVPATIVLGTADSSNIRINRFTWTDDNGMPLDRDIKTEDGIYRVLGICYQNGKRLFSGASRISFRTYDAYNRGLTAEVTLERDEDVCVDVISLQGKIVQTSHLRMQRGTSVHNLYFADLARGFYIVRVSTSSNTNHIEIFATGS